MHLTLYSLLHCSIIHVAITGISRFATLILTQFDVYTRVTMTLPCYNTHALNVHARDLSLHVRTYSTSREGPKHRVGRFYLRWMDPYGVQTMEQENSASLGSRKTLSPSPSLVNSRVANSIGLEGHTDAQVIRLDGGTASTPLDETEPLLSVTQRIKQKREGEKGWVGSLLRKLCAIHIHSLLKQVSCWRIM